MLSYLAAPWAGRHVFKTSSCEATKRRESRQNNVDDLRGVHHQLYPKHNASNPYEVKPRR